MAGKGRNTSSTRVNIVYFSIVFTSSKSWKKRRVQMHLFMWGASSISCFRFISPLCFWGVTVHCLQLISVSHISHKEIFQKLTWFFFSPCSFVERWKWSRGKANCGRNGGAEPRSRWAQGSFEESPRPHPQRWTTTLLTVIAWKMLVPFQNLINPVFLPLSSSINS